MQTINRQAYERFRRTPIDWDTYLERIKTALAMVDDVDKNKRKCPFCVSIGLKKPDEEYPEDQHFIDYESVSQVRENVSEIFDQVENPSLTAIFTETEDDMFTIMPIMPVTERVFLSMKLMGNWRRQW